MEEQYLPTGHVLHFRMGQTVYLKTDKEQKPRLVTGITLRPISVTYALVCGTTETWHYPLEISSEKDIVLSTS